MATYNTLEWQNENQLNSFPFSSDIAVPDFIIDAKFIQFDNYVPVLNYLYVDNNSIKINITYDEGSLDVLYIRYSGANHLRIYTPDGHRYIGVLTIGTGVNKLWQAFIGQKLTYNISFASDTVRSIPSSAGVFTFDRNFGEVSLARGLSDKTIFYNINTTLNSITLNAVTGHEAVGNAKGLRKLNLVEPLNNNITILSNDIIKFKQNFEAGLDVSLISGSTQKSFSLPTLY
jgi:hypothetical protein